MAAQQSKPSGTGGSKLLERAKRFVDLNEQIPWDGTDAAAFVERVFCCGEWVTSEAKDPTTTRLDLELVLQKARGILDESTANTEDKKLADVARRLRYQIATREPFVPDESADLQVSTLWAAKGLTADHVYLLGLCDPAIPGTRRDEYPGTDQNTSMNKRDSFTSPLPGPRRRSFYREPEEFRADASPWSRTNRRIGLRQTRALTPRPPPDAAVPCGLSLARAAALEAGDRRERLNHLSIVWLDFGGEL